MKAVTCLLVNSSFSARSRVSAVFVNPAAIVISFFGHALGHAGLAWESAAKCVPHGGVMQRLRETLVFMRVGIPVVRYLATSEGAKSRQKAGIFPLFCGFYAISFCFFPFLPGIAGF
jgi:hypothetical protein